MNERIRTATVGFVVRVAIALAPIIWLLMTDPDKIVAGLLVGVLLYYMFPLGLGLFDHFLGKVPQRVPGAEQLNRAIQAGDHSLAKDLISGGLDVDAPSGPRNIPHLLEACLFGRCEIVECLLDNNANANVRDRRTGTTPLIIATSVGSRNVPVSVSSADAQRIVATLIAHGADVNAQNKFGETPLYCACLSFSEPGVVEVLLASGALVNACNHDGLSPLYVAAQQGSLEVVQVLVQHGADVNVVTKQGVRPLSIASEAGYGPTVAFLLQNGACDINARSKTSGESALFLAASNGHTSVVNQLLAAGADCNIVDHFRQTPLMHAAWNGHEKTVRVLLDHGADVHRTSAKGGSALKAARAAGHRRVVSMLERAGEKA